MTLAKVFLQIGQGLDEEIAKAGRTLNAAIASSLNNLMASTSQGPAKRGLKPKTAIAAPVPQRAKPKTTTAVAAPKAPKAVSAATRAAVSRGRQAVVNGTRPKAVDALATVMGNATMKAASMVAALESRGWLPNSGSPQNYVSYLLSSNPDIFERVNRGEYRVIKGANLGKAPKTAPKAAAPKAVAKTAKAPKTQKLGAKAPKAAPVINAGTVPGGKRPKAVDALATVMGNATMKAEDVVAGLESRGWLPNSGKPQNYVSYLLSSNPDIFERVNRGEYKVIKDANLGKAAGVSSSENGSSEAVIPAPSASVASGPAPQELDEDLVDLLGVGQTSEVAGNPYHART